MAKRPHSEDPIERIVREALEHAGHAYERDKEVESGSRSIDFYLPETDLWIEVCQFYTPRKIAQLSHLPDVVLIQGRGAAEAFARLIGARRT